MLSVVLVATLIARGEVAAEVRSATQSEMEKIEALIRHVEGIEAKFVRNGVGYDAKTAGQFLRGKWKAQAAEIKTAKEFIEKVSTVSSTTGKPYLIRWPGGREVKSGEYLAAELRKLEDGK